MTTPTHTTKTPIKRVKNLTSKGATLLEYGMIVGFVAFASIGGVVATGTEVSNVLCVATNGIRTGMTTVGYAMDPIGACAFEVAEGAAPGTDTPTLPDAGAETPDGGGGQGGVVEGELGTPETPAVTPRDLVGTFKDYTYAPGRGNGHRQNRQAYIRPAEPFVFTASTVDGASIPGALTACVNSTCGPVVSQGPSTIQVPSVERFATSFRFTPNVGILEAFSFPITLTLASPTDPSRSWSQTITVARDASTVGIESLSVADVVLDPGAYLQHVVKTAPVLVGPAQAEWRATLTQVPSQTDASTIAGTLLGAGVWTDEAVATKTFTTDRANTAYRYFGNMLQTERYEALSTTFAFTIESLTNPDVVATETFTVTRDQKDLDAPEITVDNLDVKAGKFGIIEFSATLAGDGGKIVSVEPVADENGNSGPPVDILYARGSGYNLNGPLTMPATVGEAATTVRLKTSLPNGSTLIDDNVWSYKALVASTQDPAKRSVSEFTITRPSASFSADLNIQDLTLPPYLKAPGLYTSSTPIAAQENLHITLTNVTPVAASINAALNVQACLSTTCTTKANLTGTTPVSIPRTLNATEVTLRVTLANDVDTYLGFDLEFDIALAINGAPESSIEQRVRVTKPAGTLIAPAITIHPHTVQEGSGIIAIPFQYRTNDQIQFAVTNLPAGASNSIALVSQHANATGGSTIATATGGYLPAPTTKEGTIIIDMPRAQQGIDHTFTLVARPYGPGFSYTNLPAVQTPFRVQRNDLTRAAFTNVPSSVTLPAFGSKLTLAPMDFLNVPASGPLPSVFLDGKNLSNARYRLCYANNTCTNFTSNAANVYDVAGPVVVEIERTSATRAPAGSLEIRPFHKDTNYNSYGTLYTIGVQ